MKFEIQKALTGDGRTFSEEATYTFLETVYDCINKLLAKTMVKGFEEEKPIEHLKLEVTLWANGKKVDEAILDEFPKVLGFSTKALADIIIKKAYGTGGK